MNRPILYITYDGLTDPLGQSQVLPYLLGLARHGYSFHILSFEKKGSFLANRQQVDALIAGQHITWHPQAYHKWPPVFSGIYDVWQMRKKASALHHGHNFKTIWCRSYLPALAGLYLKRKFGVPFIFDMRGFWADERVDGGTWPQSNLVFRAVYRYFKGMEKRLLQEADHVVVLTNKARQVLADRKLHNNPIPKAISVIPCCADTDFFDPAKVAKEAKELMRSRLGILPHHRVLVYAGSLGTWYMLEEMLSYFKGQQAGEPDWKFLIISKDNPDVVFKRAAKLDIDRQDIVIRASSREEMPLYLSLGSRAISFIMPSFSKQASSPTKLAEYMAMGLPTVCNSGVGDVDSIIRESGAGWLFEENGSMMRGVEKTDIEIRQFTLDHFSLESGVAEYRKILR